MPGQPQTELDDEEFSFDDCFHSPGINSAGQQITPPPISIGGPECPTLDIGNSAASALVTSPTEEIGGACDSPSISLDDLDLLYVIGRGSYGKVLLVRRKVSGSLYALKVLKKSQVISGKSVKYVWAERNALTKVRHPFLTSMRYAFQSETKLYMVMDYVSGGELFFHLDNQGMMGEDLARFYGAEMVLALEYLHKVGIIHRDLKPENVLLDSKGHIKITDFGLARLFDTCAQSKEEDPETPTDRGQGQDIASSYCGTEDYMAPEVLLKEVYGTCVDWWSLGCLLYHLMVGAPPFDSETKGTPKVGTPKMAGGGGGKKKGKQKQGVKPLSKKERILKEKIKLPSFLTASCHGILKGLLERDKAARLGSGHDAAAEIKRHAFFKGINWGAMERQEVTPPLVPPGEVEGGPPVNFHDFYTEEPAIDSPTQGMSAEEPVASDMFENFTYIEKMSLPKQMGSPGSLKYFDEESSSSSAVSGGGASPAGASPQPTVPDCKNSDASRSPSFDAIREDDDDVGEVLQCSAGQEMASVENGELEIETAVCDEGPSNWEGTEEKVEKVTTTAIEAPADATNSTQPAPAPLKLNPNAPAFTFNPTASAFVPSWTKE